MFAIHLHRKTGMSVICKLHGLPYLFAVRMAKITFKAKKIGTNRIGRCLVKKTAMYTIVSGTNRTGSNTIKIAVQYRQLMEQKGVPARLVTLENLDVSTRNQAIKTLEEEVLIPSEKFIFISPEYNGSIPGVLKSLFDSSDIQRCWWGKKALLTGVSTGRAGNLRGMEHLTGILNYMKVIVHPNKLPISVVNVLLNLDGSIKDQQTLKAIDHQLNEFIDF